MGAEKMPFLYAAQKIAMQDDAMNIGYAQY